MSVFASIWDRAQPSFDANFGERLEIHHVAFRRGNQVGVPTNDPAYPPFDVVGILTLAQQVAVVKGARLDAAESQITVEQSTASFFNSVFDETRPAPKQGTKIVALDRPQVLVGGVMQRPSYFVDDPPKPDGLSRVICKLRD